MNANSINSISEFLLHAGTEYIVFDMGRRLTALDNQAFLDIENGSTVAPVSYTHLTLPTICSV